MRKSLKRWSLGAFVATMSLAGCKADPPRECAFIDLADKEYVATVGAPVTVPCTADPSQSLTLVCQSIGQHSLGVCPCALPDVEHSTLPAAIGVGQNVGFGCEAGFEPDVAGRRYFCPSIDVTNTVIVPERSAESFLNGAPNFATPVCQPATLGSVYALAMDGSANGSVRSFAVASDGTLSAPAAGGSVAVSRDSQNIALDAVGASRAFVANSNINPAFKPPFPGVVSQLVVQGDGTLAAASAATRETLPELKEARLTGDGSVLAVANFESLAAHVVGNDGTLAEGGLSVSLPGLFLTMCTVDSFVYAATSNGLAQYTVSATGVVSALTPAIVTNTSQTSVVCDQTAKRVYAASSESIATYAVGSDGTLSAVGGSVDLADLPLEMIYDAVGHHLFVANLGGALELFSIGANGLPEAMATPSFTPASFYAAGGFDATGQFFYLASGSDILQYRVTTTLEPLTPASVSLGSLSVVDFASLGR